MLDKIKYTQTVILILLFKKIFVNRLKDMYVNIISLKIYIVKL